MSRAILLLQEVNSSANAALGDDDFPAGMVETFTDTVADDLVARGFASELTTYGAAKILSGTASAVVPHNLGRAPLSVCLTGQHAEVASAYCPGATSSTFTMTVAANTTADRLVYFQLR